ncbi:MAG TPA: hypothetical protein VES19_12640, partial [Candidatus Limnocylindrales bacterium]|nr:hypothetical protein [Candidatus Limnocylindrales bacterium]
MTRHDVDSLLRDWDEVSRTARTPAPSPRPPRVTAPGLASLPLIVVAAVVIAGVAVLARPVGGPGGGGASPGGSPETSMVAVAPVTDAVDDGTLRLALTADRGTYAEGDVIVATATVEYLGPDAELKVFTAHSEVVFSVTEVGGGRAVAGGTRLSCESHTLTRGVIETYRWAKSGGYSEGDPNDAFAEAYLTSGPELRLPAGTWRLSAAGGGSEGGCGGLARALVAEVTIVVLPGTTAGGTPAPPAAVTPVPTAPSAGPSNVVTCGRFEPFVCGGVLMTLAADHAEELSAASRIV